MNFGLESITTQALSLALDAATLRQQAISSNIANANVPGYVPVGVTFESELGRVLERSIGDTAINSTLSQLKPELTTMQRQVGVLPSVMLDLEVANLSRNALQYQALVKGLSKHFAVMTAAVNDGKK